MSNYGWTNEEGEPIMDGAAYRFEQQLDMESDSYDAGWRQRMAWDDDYYAGMPDEDEHAYDMDDLNENEVPWCYGCDAYATCGDYEPDGAPCCRAQVTAGPYSGEHEPGCNG